MEGDPDPGVVGKHRDEMGGPDAGPRGCARRDDPEQADIAGGGPRAMIEIDRDQTRKQANNACDHHQPPIMLSREAGQNSKHFVAPAPFKAKVTSICCASVNRRGSGRLPRRV